MTGQYYQQPPPGQPPYGMVSPEVDSIKSLVRIAGIFGIIMAMLGIIIMIWLLIVFWPLTVIGLIPMILGIVFYMNCNKINEMMDQHQYEQAKSKTLIWMIVGIIFVNFIPGIILLIAYTKFDNLINATRGAGYVPSPPQYGATPPPQLRMCTGCGQQIAQSYNNCPHCGKAAVATAQQQQSGTRVCLGCGQHIQASYNACPHCGKQAGQ
ncbi:MAG: zinc ribbon domain-containing protein [Thermoplasmata archaeon]|nr:zinc ribbon domain-containing protein [Thermoplasmata archaeon]